jgi:arginyl-tRNA synthetase
VRIRNIFRKAGTTPEAALADFAELAETIRFGAACRRLTISGRSGCEGGQALAGAGAVHCDFRAGVCGAACFQLAQEFNNFYHKHHILTEEDPARKTLLLATAAVALRELVTGAELAGD